ncbi:MAG TPA: sigma 54-interacting transcriptional regulator [Syntrophorhabdaceae bacterium]|jgi:PAS domain S-box-containing protein|nr:sigma 54-interacting transcriptional regulator [Syntrophorhabdaceae bacterium]MDI9561906.1 sigma 54-interacting transcriptional regulator [Pseudomonadota bacterium]HOF58489.1 sigma 54-interacting transcriptional regulator [Syntrophorhabdaceae bacterium]HOS05973.1 sigma 54-interacting transcriptional regulator [Syntrophorhabdaceae bacterium]HPH40999.1 sigma 54-interacting transcriptional regulator [Syntrophorhabdaceae bacterium]
MDTGIEKHQRDVILDSINEGVFTVDPDWRITSFNKAAEKITGVSRGDSIGRYCSEVFHANICESNCALRQTFETGKSNVNVTAYIVNNKGFRIPIRISTAILKNDKGEVIGGVETFQDLSQVERLQKELKDKHTFEDIVGRSPAMMNLFNILPQISESDSTVLIEGSSGTGKELFARAIHNMSNRKKKRFVAVNCAALPDTLLESEFFGYKAGAFTDAKKDKPGRFLLADGGTIFLDEIGDISPALQVRLLRVLQERTVEPLGATEPIKIDVRVIAATNKDLSQLVQEGKFREDLFYRIKVIHLKMPTLKERKEDIRLLVDHIIEKYNRLQGKNITDISVEAMSRLIEYDYPGNVRELENIIEQAFVLCRGDIIELHHLPAELRSDMLSSEDRSSSMSLLEMEKNLIAGKLRLYGGNRKLTARELGIDVSTLYRKILKMNIDVPDVDGRGNRK